MKNAGLTRPSLGGTNLRKRPLRRLLLFEVDARRLPGRVMWFERNRIEVVDGNDTRHEPFRLAQEIGLRLA